MQILQEKKEPKFSKKQQKEITTGIVVKPNVEREPDGTLRYNLRDQPKPVYTKPNSPERTLQTKEIQKHGAKQFKK